MSLYISEFHSPYGYKLKDLLFLYTGRTLPTYEVYHFQGHFMSQELENSYGHAYGYELRDISLP